MKEYGFENYIDNDRIQLVRTFKAMLERDPNNANDDLDNIELFDTILDDDDLTDQELEDLEDDSFIRVPKTIEDFAYDYLTLDLNMTDDQIRNLIKAYNDKFKTKIQNIYLDDKDTFKFNQSVINHRDLRPFKAGDNIFRSGQDLDEETLFIMRWIAGIKFSEVLDILKFDLEDSNLVQDLNTGNIGTAQRWAKTVVGDSLECSNEMMCGRYTKPPRLATFPNNTGSKLPITKRIDISSVCSHHLLPYGTLLREGSYAIVSYVPSDYVLGISKLQRLADWTCRRPTIQEDLTRDLWKSISRAARTKDVMVMIVNARHTCEYLRGSQSQDGSFSTIHYDGVYSNDDFRASVINTVQ